MGVGRPRKDPKEMLVEVPCKVPPQVAEEIARLSIVMDRSRSQIARKFIVRGLAAYKRDGEIDEPSEDTKKPPTKIRSGPAPKPARRDRSNELIDGAFGRHGQKASKKDRETMRKSLEEDETPDE